MTPPTATCPATAAPVAPAAAAPAATPRALDRHRHAYLVGIGGSGMCGAAELLVARGIRVRGSDRTPSARTERLARFGIPVDLAEDPACLPADATLVVASAAVSPAHPQIVEAHRRGLVVWKYAECLGALMEGRVGIAVAGCHGKTTTSALVATALWRAGRDPSFVIGGEVRDLAASARGGKGPHFVAEACEYDRSFLRLRPRIAIVTNIDADHLDYYRDLDEIREAFRDYARLLPPDGVLVVHEAYAATFRGDSGVRARIVTYGSPPGASGFRVVDPHWDAKTQSTRFWLWRDGAPLATLSVPLAGTHNALNAAGAAVALLEAGLSLPEIAEGLARFGGTGRRMERVAERGGVTVLDDYGHHPAEIRAVIRAARTRYPGRRLLVAFQPHQASRTRILMSEFAEALAGADEVLLAPIYCARDTEEDRQAVTSESLAALVRGLGGNAATAASLTDLADRAAPLLRPGDVLVTMGAGNVDEVARAIAARLR
jgi:UDP-N-acetylmuramate--alanine ligase